MKYYIILSLLIFITPNTLAQQKTNDAVLCSAIYYVATAGFGANPQASKSLMGIQQTFELIFSANQNRVVSKGEVKKIKHIHLMYLGNLYDRSPEKIYNIENRCNSWREKIAPKIVKFVKTTKNFTELKKQIKTLPKMPTKTFSKSNPRWERSKNMMDISFQKWTDEGRTTSYSVTEAVKKRLEKK